LAADQRVSWRGPLPVSLRRAVAAARTLRRAAGGDGDGGAGRPVVVGGHAPPMAKAGGRARAVGGQTSIVSTASA